MEKMAYLTASWGCHLAQGRQLMARGLHAMFQGGVVKKTHLTLWKALVWMILICCEVKKWHQDFQQKHPSQRF